MKFTYLYFLLAIICGMISTSNSSAVPTKQCVPFGSIQALTFHKHRYTAYNRVPAVPQLECKHGCYNDQWVDSIMCQNVGFAGALPSWACQSQLPDHMNLVDTHVSCEGCDYAGDSNVLVGSCSVSYGLKLSNEKYYNGPPLSIRTDDFTTASDLIYGVFLFAFLALFIFGMAVAISSPTVYQPGYIGYRSYYSPSYYHPYSGNGFWSGYMWGRSSRPTYSTHYGGSSGYSTGSISGNRTRTSTSYASSSSR
jgi:hypothetical protein